MSAFPIHLTAPDFAIDMGTCNTRIYVRGRGIVVNEASIVITRTDRKNSIVAVGDSAMEIIGRSSDKYKISFPISRGIITDSEGASVMVNYFVNKAIGKPALARPRGVMTMPTGATEPERRTMISTLEKNNVRNIFPVEQAFAAALGTGLPVYEAQGSMILSIGGGTCEIALVALGGMVLRKSVPIAGHSIDMAISNYLKHKYAISITNTAAELIKIDIPDILGVENSDRISVVRGRDIATGMPMTVDVSMKEISEAAMQPLRQIAAEVHRILEQTPPELCADILQNGIFLTGGTAQLLNLDQFLASEFGIPVSVAREPSLCAIRGAGYMADHYDLLKVSKQRKEST